MNASEAKALHLYRTLTEVPSSAPHHNIDNKLSSDAASYPRRT